MSSQVTSSEPQVLVSKTQRKKRYIEPKTTRHTSFGSTGTFVVAGFYLPNPQFIHQLVQKRIKKKNIYLAPKRHVWRRLGPFSSSPASQPTSPQLVHQKLVQNRTTKKKSLTQGPNDTRRIVWACFSHCRPSFSQPGSWFAQ